VSFQEHSTELLPWMEKEYEQLVNLESSGKLAHAYLLCGQQGLGKAMLARHFAHYLLCTARKESHPCHDCRECELLAAGTHPDLKYIQPEDSAEIKIDQVRNTIEFVSQTSQRGGYKVVIYRPAEAMNINSANALLKVLEEPAQNTLLILISHQPALLMATIRSRCHAIKFNRPSAEKVIPWLEAKNVHASATELLRMANNIPLRALHYADDDALHDRAVLHNVMEKLLKGEMDISGAAKSCEDFSLEENIEGMILCASDILAYIQASAAGNQSTLNDHDLQNIAQYFQNRTTLKALHDFYRELLKSRRAALSTSNPNPTLVIESLFYNWSQTARP